MPKRKAGTPTNSHNTHAKLVPKKLAVMIAKSARPDTTCDSKGRTRLKSNALAFKYNATTGPPKPQLPSKRPAPEPAILSFIGVTNNLMCESLSIS